MFSKACEYGIKAIIYIATQSLSGTRVKIGDVANNSGSPEAFTAKILGTLTKHNIVNSHTGPYGGFEISSKQMKQVKMRDIVEAIDGDTIFNGCGLGLNECNHEQPCPMHHKFVKVREEIKTMLTTTTIYDLATEYKSGKTVLMR
ncbi:MAG: Rrf2 family transcriptional regulator [Bacteroidetes bacterium]|nr:Rrf2 family transcriptional regulator [Bacteroidota bacterium]MBS1541312.1 Rrf2 family transcriptional regulator [Bacteroidota bacterium]